MKRRVQVEIQNGVADVRLSRSDKSNSIDRAMFDALIDSGEQLKKLPGLRAVVISGEGKGFCAGIDRSVLEEMHMAPLPVSKTSSAERTASAIASSTLPGFGERCLCR